MQLFLPKKHLVTPTFKLKTLYNHKIISLFFKRVLTPIMKMVNNNCEKHLNLSWVSVSIQRSTTFDHEAAACAWESNIFFIYLNHCRDYSTCYWVCSQLPLCVNTKCRVLFFSNAGMIIEISFDELLCSKIMKWIEILPLVKIQIHS